MRTMIAIREFLIRTGKAVLAVLSLGVSIAVCHMFSIGISHGQGGIIDFFFAVVAVTLYVLSLALAVRLRFVTVVYLILCVGVFYGMLIILMTLSGEFRAWFGAGVDALVVLAGYYYVRFLHPKLPADEGFFPSKK